MLFLKNCKQRRGKRVERKKKREDGKGREWTKGRPVFIGEVRYLAAFLNAAELHYLFSLTAGT